MPTQRKGVNVAKKFWIGGKHWFAVSDLGLHCLLRPSVPILKVNTVMAFSCQALVFFVSVAQWFMSYPLFFCVTHMLVHTNTHTTYTLRPWWLSQICIQLVIMRFDLCRVREHSFVHEIFSMVVFPPSADSRRAVVSFWWKNVHKLIWLTTKPDQEKVWFGKQARHDLNPSPAELRYVLPLQTV